MYKPLWKLEIAQLTVENAEPSKIFGIKSKAGKISAKNHFIPISVNDSHATQLYHKRTS